MIFVGSRYETADVEYVLDPTTGQTHPTVFRKPAASRLSSMYVWRSGDRLDILAQERYGSPDDWWRIMDANPGIVDPYRLRPGMLIRLP